MLSRRTRTMLPTSDHLLQSTSINYDQVLQDINNRRNTSKQYYDRTAGPPHAPLTLGSYAYAKPPPHKRGKPWTYGRIVARESPRSYTVSTPTGNIRRNRIQVRPAAPPNHATAIQPICPVIVHAPAHNLPSPQLNETPSNQHNCQLDSPATKQTQEESNQLDPCQVPTPNPGVQGVTSSPEAAQPETSDTPEPRRGRRITRLPAKLNDYILE